MLREVFGLAVLLASSGLSAAALAQSSRGPSPEDWARIELARSIARSGMTWKEAQQIMGRLFRVVDRDGNGVSPDDYAQNRRINDAAQRAAALHRLLARDLDNDGAVSRAELVAFFTPQAAASMRSNGGEIEPTPQQRDAILNRLVLEALQADRNGDDVISFEEMRLAAAQSVDARRFPDPSNLIPMSLDRNGDGIVSRDEYDAVLRAAFREADANGDDAISADEAEAFRQKAQESKRLVEQIGKQDRLIAEAKARAAACGFPRLPEQVKLVLVGTYEGKALSTASVGGDDREVTVSRIDVEPGSDPLYLVLTSHRANIWLVTGAVDRVRQVVAIASATGSGEAPRVGVVGVEKAKVYVPPRADCLSSFSEHPSSESQAAVAAFTGHLDRAPDILLASYDVATLGVPSGTLHDAVPLPGAVALPTEGPAAGIWKEMLRHNPAGLVRVDPGTVVSRLPVKRYDVLPQQAGLAQLIEDGSLKVTAYYKPLLFTGERLVSAEPTPREVLILRKIRFPAGLSDAHSIKFILARGVPRPEGDLGDSCVVAEETGQAVAGVSSRC